MINRRTFTSAAALFALTACSSKISVYSGPPVTSIVVQKGRRKLFLLNQNAVLESFDFELGFAPMGHKEFEGDGKTPEGAYYIDRKNPNSQFYLSVGISYPNDLDRAKARDLGLPPGGDIFIHGTPQLVGSRNDWTAGCIAVKDKEIEDIFKMVNVGTPIFLFA